MTLVWDSRAAHSAVPCSLLPVIARQGPEHDSCPLPMAGAAPSAQADPPPALQLPSSREPDANALCLLSHRPPVATDALVGIQADHTVVEQGEEGCQGTGCHKDGDEAKLQD